MGRQLTGGTLSITTIWADSSCQSPDREQTATARHRLPTAGGTFRIWRLIGLLLLLAQSAPALTFTVTSATDESDATVGDGLCQTAGGACTLRAALEEATATVVDEIALSVDGITLLSNLPVISTPLIIGSCAHPVQLHGDATLDWGLRVGGNGGATLRGWVVSGFTKRGDHSDPATNGIGVRLDSDGNTVDCSQMTDSVFGAVIFGARNLLSGVRASGNAENGVLVSGPTARRNRILDSVFGLTADGMAAEPNGSDGIGVVDGASRTLIKGVVASGNLGAGIEVSDHGHDTKILNSTIGLNTSGTAPVGNHKVGIKFLGPGNLVSGCVISGHTIGADSVYSRAPGVEVEYPRNRVRRSRIGTTPDGRSAMPNALGVVVLAGENEVSRNNISGNLYDGIVVLQDNDDDCLGDPECPTTNVLVAKNQVGVAVDGITPLGNGRTGIGLNGTPDVPGATFNNRVVANTIANNGASGISTYDYIGLGFGAAGTGNALYGNTLYNNAGNNGARGIDLTLAAFPTPSEGVTPNHVGTVNGPNDFQNHPDITSVARRGDHVDVELVLSSDPLRGFLVELCSNDIGDPECHWPLLRKTVRTDAAGIVEFTMSVPANVPGGALTATASRRLEAGIYSTSEASAEFLLP
jgi:CSLREA domain-containing protein